MTYLERYLFTLQAAKAAMRAYGLAPSEPLFQHALESVAAFQRATQGFMEFYGKHPPHTSPPDGG